MLQQLLDAERDGELKLSKQDILQAELPPELIKKRKRFWRIAGLVTVTYTVVLISLYFGLSFFRCSFWGESIAVCGALLFGCLCIVARCFFLKPIERRYNKCEFDLLCANQPSYMSGIEYTTKVKSMSCRIDGTISLIAGDNLRKYFDDYQSNSQNDFDYMLTADVLLRNIDTRYRRKIHSFIENYPVFTLLGLPISFLCLGALTEKMLSAHNMEVRAAILFIVVASLLFAPLHSAQYDSYRNDKKKQEAKPYENLRKALNAIIES